MEIESRSPSQIVRTHSSVLRRGTSRVDGSDHVVSRIQDNRPAPPFNRENAAKGSHDERQKSAGIQTYQRLINESTSPPLLNRGGGGTTKKFLDRIQSRKFKGRAMATPRRTTELADRAKSSVSSLSDRLNGASELRSFLCFIYTSCKLIFTKNI